MSIKNLFEKVSTLVVSSNNSPEESIRFFLKKLIDGAKELADHYPRHMSASIIPMKRRVFQDKIEEADLLIEKYNSYILRITLLWVSIMKRWYQLKTIEMGRIITLEIVDFENDLTQSFLGMNHAALEQNKEISFILKNYKDLTSKEIKNLEKIKKSLITISKMTYSSFIKEILEKEEIEEA